jgi:hypothetical protein
MSHEVDHVEDTLATRAMGIVLGIMIVFTSVMIQQSMGWHPVVGGIFAGAFGMLFGALGTSVRGPITAAIFGWGGGLAFFASILMFFGLRLF